MPYPASSYPEGVDLTIIAGNQLHQVINGEANEVVSTTSGDIPSVRKALADSMMFKVPVDWVQGEVTTDPLETRLYNGQPYWAPEATLANPITLGSSPVATTDWLLAPQGYRNEYNLGKYQAGILISDSQEYVVYNGKSYFAISPPYTTTSTTPDDDTNLFIGGYITSDFGTVVSGTEVKHRRGTNAEVLAGTPAIGEIWFNTTDNSIHMGDGATPGGIKHVNTNTIQNYTDLVYKASVGNSAVANMVNGNPIAAKIGDVCSTGATTWERVTDTLGTIGDFVPLGAIYTSDILIAGGSASANTAAVQLYFDYSQDAGVPFIISSIIDIDSPILLTKQVGFDLIGLNIEKTGFRQVTDGVPVIQFDNININKFNIKNFTVSYQNQQVKEVRAIVTEYSIDNGSGIYNGDIDRLFFVNCGRSFSASVATKNAPWGIRFGFMIMDASCTGSLLYLKQAPGKDIGTPAFVVDKIYARCDNLQEALIYTGASDGMTINNIEINGGQDVTAVSTTTNATVSIGSLRLESVTYTNAGAPILDIQQTDFVCDLLLMTGGSVPVGWRAVSVFSPGKINLAKFGMIKLTSSISNAAYVFSGGGRIMVDSLSDTGSNFTLTDLDAQPTAEEMKVTTWEDGFKEITSNYIIDPSGPKVIEDSAGVDINLPSAYNPSNVYEGQVWDIFNSAASDTTIRTSSGSFFYTLPAGSSKRVVYRRNGFKIF